MSQSVVVIGILAVAGAAVLAFLFANASRQRRAAENVPPGMRPGYSDEQLERSVLERYMAWGVVLTLFFAVFFPVYWIREQSRTVGAVEASFVSQVVAGEALYVENCSQCHGGNLGGGAAPSPYDPESQWPAPNLSNIATRYADNRNVADIEQFIIRTLQIGRPGTPMQAFGGQGGGPLTDEQLNDIALYILTNQVEETEEASAAADLSGEQLYTDNCLRCHGEQLQGADGDPARPGKNLVGVFQRHSEESILGILQNGILVPTGAVMPPWQNGYQEQPYTDEALQTIIDYLREQQPADALPDEGGTEDTDEEGDAADDGGADGATDEPSPSPDV